uniref:Uncharacterized protein n=1 Tax=Arundo donax TaxID=35708 RepID=A0A0A9GS97_ARUDO
MDTSICVDNMRNCATSLYETEMRVLPPGPLKVLPETTPLCIQRGYCYHREYMTDDTSETARTTGYATGLLSEVISL